MELLRYYEIDKNTNKAKRITVTDTEISSYLQDSNKQNDLANFIYLRHYHRFIKPFEFKSVNKIIVEETGKKHNEFSLLYKNGFSIMANCCLLIETFEAFYWGWKTTKDKSKKAFLKFFERDSNFTEFSTGTIPQDFYYDIRCGILHQGETRNGWTITREATTSIADKRINATTFLENLHQSLKDYKKELIETNWNGERWTKAKDKIQAIIDNA